MRSISLASKFTLALIATLLLGPLLARENQGRAFAQAKGPTKDEVFFSLARRVNAESQSPVTDVVNALGTLIDVGEITVGPDGKATVIIKELAQSNSRSTNKTIRTLFAPSSEAGKWTWEQFEDNRKLYPVERLFPYTKERLTSRKQATVDTWNKYLESMTAEGEAAGKVLDTAKVILKNDPPPMNPVKIARTALEEAKKGTEVEPIINAHRELETAIEPVAELGETFPDLKANDAFLRLQEILKGTRAQNLAAKKAYLNAVFVYNDEISRLPFSLVAHGMEFTKVEPKIPAEQ
jgi:LemA protein